MQLQLDYENRTKHQREIISRMNLMDTWITIRTVCLKLVHAKGKYVGVQFKVENSDKINRL